MKRLGISIFLICIQIITLNATEIEHYLSFLQEETTRHREYISDFYDSILYIISSGFAVVSAILVFFQWSTLKDVKRKFRNYWEKGIKKGFELRKNQIDSEINRLTLDIKNERIKFDELHKAYQELESKITFLNKLYWNKANGGNQINKSNIHILWIDDNPQNNSALIDMFRDNDISVTTALDTEDALKILTDNNTSKCINLIITDMARFGDQESGIELLEILHNMSYAPPILVYTSPDTEKVLIKKAYQLGAKLVTSIPNDIIDFVNNL